MTEELKQAAPRNHGPIQETDLYDFAGWLTTRPGVMNVGSSCEAGPMVEAVGEYIKTYPERFALTAAQPAHAAQKLFTPGPDCDSPEICTYGRRCAGRFHTQEVCQRRSAAQAAQVPEGVQWFTVAEHGMPDFDEKVIGGLWYTDPWLKPDRATRFMWGLCRVLKDDHRDFKDGKRWHTFGPSHNDITHWARLNTPALTAAQQGAEQVKGDR